MPRRSSRQFLSQPSTSRGSKSQRLENDKSFAGLSQTRIDQHFAESQLDINEQINNCVRYFVYNAGQKMYFRRADIYKNVLSKVSVHQFQQIIEKTADILKNVYGYNLLVCDREKTITKAYVVTNAMPYKNYNLNDNNDDNEVKKIVLIIILSHIYMSNNCVTEASLYAFLNYLNIDANRRHPLFGQVKDHIMNVLVKQKYLSMETDPVSKKVSFSWGIRSEKEISKHEILTFVCKMYKDRIPKSWNKQFQNAEEQGFENNHFFEGRAMDVGEE